MITLIHGDDTEKSRLHLNELIAAARGKELRRVDGRRPDITEFATILGSPSMVGQEHVIVTENLLSSLLKKPTKLTPFLEMAARVPKETSVILWEGKELSKTIVAKLGADVKVALFKVPVVLFQFLDAIAPSRAALLIELYQRLHATQADELIFYLIARRLRQLLILGSGGSIAELAPWQAARLTTQARRFTMEKLREMYKNLLTIEYSFKNGLTPFTLTELTEQFLFSL